MQTLAFLWFELQTARQRLRTTFAEAEVPANATNLNAPSGIGTRRYASAKQVPRIEPAQRLRASGSLSHYLFRVTGSLFHRLHCNKAQSRGAIVEPSKSRTQPPARGLRSG
jgi:hypothetical protein